jgi:hypothetical protein
MTELGAIIAVMQASVRRRGEIPMTKCPSPELPKMAARYRYNVVAQTEAALDEAFEYEKRWGSS